MFLWTLLFLGWTMYTVVLYRRTRAARQDAKRLATKEADKRADAARRRQRAWWVCSAIVLLLILLIKKIKNESTIPEEIPVTEEIPVPVTLREDEHHGIQSGQFIPSLVMADADKSTIPEEIPVPVTLREDEHRGIQSGQFIPSLVMADESTIPEEIPVPVTLGKAEHRGIQSVQFISKVPKVAPLVRQRQIPTERTQLRKPDARKQLQQVIDAPWWEQFLAQRITRQPSTPSTSTKPSTTRAPAPQPPSTSTKPSTTQTLAQRIARQPPTSTKPSTTQTLAQRIARQPPTPSTSTTRAPTQNTWKIARTSQPRATNSKPRDAHDAEMRNIWKEKNPYLNNRQTREFDFHGLRVQDALDRLEDVIRTKCNQGIQDVTLISGRGLHSAGGIPKIKPAFEQYFRANRMRYRPVHQGGAFEVHLNCT